MLIKKNLSSQITKYDKTKGKRGAAIKNVVVVNFILGYKISETNWKGFKEEGFLNSKKNSVTTPSTNLLACVE